MSGPPGTSRLLPSGDLFRRLRRGGAWVVACRTLGMMAVFTNFAVLAKILPEHEFADYVLAVSLVTLTSVLGMCGLNSLVCRRIAAHLGTDGHLQARKSLTIVAATAALSISIVAVLFYFSCTWLAGSVFQRPELADMAFWLAAWMGLLAISQFVAEIYRGLHNLFAASLLGGVSGGLAMQAIFLVAIGTTYHTLGQLDFTLIAQLAVISFCVPVIGSVAGLMLMWPRAAARCQATVTAKRPQSMAGVLAEALPIMLLNLSALGMDKVGQLILAVYGTDLQLSIYEGVWLIAFVGLTPLTLVGLAVASTISELQAQGDKQTLQRVLRGAATVSTLVTLPLLFVICLVPHAILGVVFKPSFEAGATALVVMCAAQAVRNCMGPSDVTLIMTGHQTSAFLCLVIAAPLLLLGPWAVQHYGLTGVTVVVFAAGTLARGLQFLMVRLHLGIWAHASMSPQFVFTLFSASLARSVPRLVKTT